MEVAFHGVPAMTLSPPVSLTAVLKPTCASESLLGTSKSISVPNQSCDLAKRE